jgi:hypothetical protein
MVSFGSTPTVIFFASFDLENRNLKGGTDLTFQSGVSDDIGISQGLIVGKYQSGIL